MVSAFSYAHARLNELGQQKKWISNSNVSILLNSNHIVNPAKLHRLAKEIWRSVLVALALALRESLVRRLLPW
jgi:hypothetical protein